MLKAAILLSLSLLGADDLIRRSADYELQLVGDSSIRVKLDARMWLPGGSAVTTVCSAGMPLSDLRVDAKPVAPVVRDGAVLVSVVGRGEHRVGFTALVAVDPDARPQQIVLQTLRSAVMQLRFKLPSNAVGVSVEPAVRTERRERENELVAHLPCTDSVTVQWQERVAEDRGPVVVYARCIHRVSVGRAAASGQTKVDFDLPRGGLTSTTFLVQKGCSVLKVTGDTVRDWQVGQQKLSVFFRGEQTRSTGLTIGFEVPVGTLPHRLNLPAFGVGGVERESGTLSVVSEKGAVATLLELDCMKQSESPRATIQQFAYAAAPASATFSVEEPTRLDVRVHAEINGLIAVGDAADHGTAVIRYSIFGVPVNEVRFALPKGTTLQDVVGPDVVTTTVEPQNDLSIATVKLANPRNGEYELVIRYEMLQPETASEFSMPLVTVPGAIGQIGRVGVCSVTSAELVAVKVERAQRMMPRQLPARIQSNAQTPLLFGFKYRQRPSIVLGVKRHEPTETADAMVDLVESTTVLTRDGAAVTKQQFVVRNRGRQFLTLEYSQDVSIWSVFVAGKPVKPGQAGPRQTLIPLIRSAREGNQLMPVSAEVVWATRSRPLGSRGKIKLALPQVDANVSATQWGIYTPSAFKFEVKDSNVQKFEPTRTAVLLAEGAKEAGKLLAASTSPFVAGKPFEEALEKQADTGALRARVRVQSGEPLAEARRRSQGAKMGRRLARVPVQTAEDREQQSFRRKKSVLFTQGWEALREERFEDAYEVAGQILELDSQDQSAKILRDRAFEEKHVRKLRGIKERFAKELKRHPEQTYDRAVPLADFVTYPKKEVWEDVISRRRKLAAGPAGGGESPGMLKIMEKLKERVSLDFADTPLTDAIAFLHDVSDVNMMLDPDAIEEDSPKITLKVEDMPLENALDVILRRFAKLDYAVRDEGIFISNEEALSEHELRTYDVHDLLAAAGAAGERTQGGMGGGGMDEGGTDTTARARDLLELISTMVKPESWQYAFVSGGGEDADAEVELVGEAEDAQGGLVFREGKLIVHQTPRVHTEISNLLTSLRRSGPTDATEGQAGPEASALIAEGRRSRTATPPPPRSEPPPVSPARRRYASRAGLLAPPIDLAVDGDFHYFRRAYPGSSKEPPFVEFRYRKRSGSP